MALTIEQWKRRQRRLNAFVKERKLLGVVALEVDGDPGPLTRKRIRACHFWLGYKKRTSRWSDEFADRMRNTFDEELTPREMIRLGIERRRAHNRAVRRSQQVGAATAGVRTFEGKPVAAWLVPYLKFARDKGWRGVVISGFRDPAHSERVCIEICGRPTCGSPRPCAGRNSNHSGSVKPRGAIDVSLPASFGQLMKRCPLKPPIFNALGSGDPEHFSATGN